MSERITPDYQPHRDLEIEVDSYLGLKGFITASATYHDVLPECVQKALQNQYTPTALYIRTRADRIAIHEEKQIAFEWEAKTHQSRQRHDWLVEITPIMMHAAKDDFDVRCLYCYRNPHTDHECGFWVSDRPAFREIHLTTRIVGLAADRMRIFCSRFFSGVRVRKLDRPTAGSNDAYGIIDQSVVESLPHWKTLIDSSIESEIDDPYRTSRG